jgi:hypothetical protein
MRHTSASSRGLRVWTQHQILSLLLAHGYNDLGIRALLEATRVP